VGKKAAQIGKKLRQEGCVEGLITSSEGKYNFGKVRETWFSKKIQTSALVILNFSYVLAFV
jgi:hypothetical protein